MEKINQFLDYTFTLGNSFNISLETIAITLVILVVTSIVLKQIRNLITRKLDENDKPTFISVFSYIRYFVFVLIILVVLSSSGVNLTALFTSAAVILLGIGLALQTLFQDIITGLFILFDKTLRVNDTIEIDGKTGKVLSINLRTTRMVTLEQKIYIIPNHFFLSNALYNWTQNGLITRESISVGVAYGSDVELVKKSLIQAASNIPTILKNPKPAVLFVEFGESSLNFILAVSVKDGFRAIYLKSDLHFEIYRLFKLNNISIPFPQRDLHIVSNSAYQDKNLENQD